MYKYTICRLVTVFTKTGFPTGRSKTLGAPRGVSSPNIFDNIYRHTLYVLKTCLDACIFVCKEIFIKIFKFRHKRKSRFLYMFREQHC